MESPHTGKKLDKATVEMRRKNAHDAYLQFIYSSPSQKKRTQRNIINRGTLGSVLCWEPI